MRIYRFGCRKGDAAAGCDCDLMVIVDESGEPSERRARAAHDALEGLRPPKDVVVLTRDEFDRRAHLGGVPASISWAGSLLYGR
jgi:hypothetical protein